LWNYKQMTKPITTINGWFLTFKIAFVSTIMINFLPLPLTLSLNNEYLNPSDINYGFSRRK
jgi:hypothetical protein